jgi:hypothetical protein
LSDNVSIDPQTGRPIIDPKFYSDALDIVRNNPGAPSAAAAVRTMFDWGESQQNKEVKAVDDPLVKQGLTDRLFDPTNPTTRIDLTKASAAGKLSDHSFQSMERLVTELETSPLKGPVWQATAAAAKDALIVSIPGAIGKDMKGTESYASFMQSFIPQYLAKSRAGTLEPNALDVKDPNSMISKAMAPFKRTAAQRMSDYVVSFGGLANVPEPPAPATPTPSAVPKLPADREAGHVYPTPQGPYKWTGTGWVKPDAEAFSSGAAMQYNEATRQWRNKASGAVYDSVGRPVK